MHEFTVEIGDLKTGQETKSISAKRGFLSMICQAREYLWDQAASRI
jgi:hypothetical protein